MSLFLVSHQRFPLLWMRTHHSCLVGRYLRVCVFEFLSFVADNLGHPWEICSSLSLHNSVLGEMFVSFYQTTVISDTSCHELLTRMLQYGPSLVSAVVHGDTVCSQR